MTEKDNRYREHSDSELKWERIRYIVTGFIQIGLTITLIGFLYFCFTSESVHAMSLSTTLTSRPDTAEQLQEMKGYDTEAIAEFIAKYEDFSPTPFPDPSGNGYVIGFGFQPRGRTYMTRLQATRILEAEVKRLVPQVTAKYGFQSQNKMMALVSILYNTPTYRKVVTSDEVIEDFRNGRIEKLRKHFKHSLRGIQKRRNDELALYFSTFANL